MEKRLTKSSNKMICGVIAGLGEYFDLKVDPTLLRLGYVALSFVSAAFPGLLLYIIMAIIMPEK